MNMLRTNIYFKLFNELLAKAETLYGQRDKSYAIHDIVMSNEDEPGIDFIDDYTIIISLGKDCISPTTDITKYQLSHEIIHCLQPNEQQDVTILEEGVAVYYSLQCSPDIRISTLEYKIAYDLINELLVYDNELIKKVRMYESNLSRLTPTILLNACHDIPMYLISELTKKFY